jgi:hypothetical protein
MKSKNKKHIYYTLAALLLMCNFKVSAQFSKVGKGFNRPVHTLYTDTVTNKILAGGEFYSTYQDSLPLVGIGVWDGFQWDSVGKRIEPNFSLVVSSSIGKFYRYKGDLYVRGNFGGAGSSFPSYNYPNRIGKFDTINKEWELVPCIPFYYGGVGIPNIIDDTMYITGVTDTLACGNNVEANIFKFDGTSIYPSHFSNFPYYSSNAVHLMTKYNGEYYMSGGIYNPADFSFKTFQKWNGLSWVDIPGATANPGTEPNFVVRKFMEYNNELYISGYFFSDYGAPGNCIAKFDGTNWYNLGGGVAWTLSSPTSGNPRITDFTFYHGELYVVGLFNYAGGVPAQNIAKWDGTDWCGLGSSIDNGINAIEVYNDTLYIGGGFRTIDGDSVNFIAKWTGGNYVDTCGHIVSGINEITNQNDFIIYPNPASSTIIIESSKYQVQSIRIMDVLGQEIYYLQTANNKTEVDISHLPSGIYILQVQSKSGVVSKKFVKE